VIFNNSCRLFGAGVILSTAFIHMFIPAVLLLTDPCLSAAFNEDYEAFAGLFPDMTNLTGLFAMLGVFAMQIVQFGLTSYYSKSHTKQEYDAEDEDSEKTQHMEEDLSIPSSFQVESADTNKTYEEHVKLDTTDRKAKSTKVTNRTTVLLLESGIGMSSSF
jgi:hypothetical protein